jgi:hypothetical protein
VGLTSQMSTLSRECRAFFARYQERSPFLVNNYTNGDLYMQMPAKKYIVSLVFVLLGSVTLVLALGSEYDGIVKVTTSPDGMWSYVTVASESGEPLRTAFVVQYQNPMPSVTYSGIGRVIPSKDALEISSASDGLTFKFPSYKGQLPAGRKAVDVIGIAAYSWPKGRPIPASHDEFVTQMQMSPLDKPKPCNYSECTCGGAGAQSCNCQGVSVSCYAPYDACCNVPQGRGYCCSP